MTTRPNTPTHTCILAFNPTTTDQQRPSCAACEELFRRGEPPLCPPQPPAEGSAHPGPWESDVLEIMDGNGCVVASAITAKLADRIVAAVNAQQTQAAPWEAFVRDTARFLRSRLLDDVTSSPDPSPSSITMLSWLARLDALLKTPASQGAEQAPASAGGSADAATREDAALAPSGSGDAISAQPPIDGPVTPSPAEPEEPSDVSNETWTLDLDALERLANAATPGRWEAVLLDDPRGQPAPYYRALIATTEHGDRHLSIVAADRETVPREEWQPNAEYIAAASPSVVLELIRMVRGVRR